MKGGARADAGRQRPVVQRSTATNAAKHTVSQLYSRNRRRAEIADRLRRPRSNRLETVTDLSIRRPDQGFNPVVGYNVFEHRKSHSGVARIDALKCESRTPACNERLRTMIRSAAVGTEKPESVDARELYVLG